MAIMLTEKARKQIAKVMQEQNMTENHFLRIGISAGGCSGFKYSLEFEEMDKYDDTKDDKIVFDEFMVVVDSKSDLYLDGTTLDFHDELNKMGFVFNNPNATKSCGCGSSFSA